MVKPNLNILRNLRLQLKTGFLQKEPAAYKFLQRYPPLSRDTAPPVRQVETRTIPYLKYYEKAVAANPMYADEKVYPAYWVHEPQALTLAKKQYELLQKSNGTLSEEEAYQQALTYVDELENASFLKLKAVLADIKGAKLPYAADAALSGLIADWRAKLAVTRYGELSLADQGEIDWIVQTKVLRWHEVERERRMKDPIFVLQFERLRAAVFPEIALVSDEVRKAEQEDYKAKLFTFFGVNRDRLSAAKPFFYDDYARFFRKLKEQPLLARWDEAEREALSHWIIDTLALREVLERRTSSAIQRYLDALRGQFFPMVRYPERAASFSLPAEKELKALLYSNDVGYKREDGRLYIRRAYRLPQLLFPQETLTTALLTTQQQRLPGLLNNDSSLLAEMQRVGLDEATLPELQRQLQEYTTALAREGGGLGGGARGEGEMDMSPLDALLRDDDDESDKTAASASASASASAASDSAAAAGSGSGSDAPSAASSDEQLAAVAAAPAARSGVLPDMTLNTPAALGKEEWARLVARYFRPPSTELEQRRDELFRMASVDQPEDAEDEMDLEHHRRARSENMLVTRARLSVEYEKKEAARRVREWRARGVWLEKLPRAQLSITDNRE